MQMKVDKERGVSVQTDISFYATCRPGKQFLIQAPAFNEFLDTALHWTATHILSCLSFLYC